MSGFEEYAKALFLLSEERHTTDYVAEDAKTVLEVLKKEPAYHNLADTPALPTGEKVALIDRAFGSLDRDLLSLLKILCERRVFYAAPQIMTDYLALVDEARGIIRVVAITAVEMEARQIRAMAEKLEQITKKTVRIENRVDPSVLGGVRLRCQGIQLDSTLRTRLDTLEKSLKTAIV